MSIDRLGYDYANQILDPDFCRWAWGIEMDERIFLNSLGLLELWNERHGKDLILFPAGEMVTDLIRMSELWANQGYPREMK